MATLAPVDAAAARAVLPPVLTIDGCDGVVTIRRDSAGIPHIEAASADDVCIGQGFATAQDRMWQLEWDRRRALGRSAELIGSPAMVVNDCFHRRARLRERALAGYEALDPQTRSMLDAHARGVNAFMSATAARPVEFQALGCPDEPWEGWHGVAVFLVRHVTFATWQTKLWNARVLAALGPDAVTRFRIEGSSGDSPVIVPPGARAAVGALVDAGLFDGPSSEVLESLEPLGLQQSGSNAWVVGGPRTADGAPQVAGDPHRPFEVHNVYYQVRLTTPSFDVAGFAFPGVPGVQHFAQNASVAWAVTNATADYQDLFIERLPEATIDRRIEVVHVRHGGDVEVECLSTRHGPVVLGGTGHGVGVALASTGLIEAGGSLRCILPLMRAHTVSEMDAALADWVEPANNFVMADADGHIAYRTAGRIPLHPLLSSILPVPGWDPAYDWTGHVPDASMPRLVDPATAAIVTANQRITTRDTTHELNYDAAAGHRAERIWARLGDRTGLTVADHAAIHRDAVSRPALALARRVVGAGGDQTGLLSGWDGSMSTGSSAALLCAQINQELCRLVVSLLPEALQTNPFARWEPPATALPAVLRVANAIAGWLAADDTTVISGRPWEPLLIEAAARAVATLTADDGPDPSTWEWGRRHEARPLHPAQGLDPGLDLLIRPTSGPVSGAADCVLATNQVTGIGMAAMSGSTARYVWDLGDRTRSGWIVPLGASGHHGSPHRSDQTPSWVAGELRPVFDPVQTSSIELHPSIGRGAT